MFEYLYFYVSVCYMNSPANLDCLSVVLLPVLLSLPRCRIRRRTKSVETCITYCTKSHRRHRALAPTNEPFKCRIITVCICMLMNVILLTKLRVHGFTFLATLRLPAVAKSYYLLTVAVDTRKFYVSALVHGTPGRGSQTRDVINVRTVLLKSVKEVVQTRLHFYVPINGCIRAIVSFK